jgi:hypothetical protein
VGPRFSRGNSSGQFVKDLVDHYGGASTPEKTVGGFDPDTADIQVEHMSIDTPRNDGVWQVDPLEGQDLDEGFGDNSSAHVAAGRPGAGEIPALTKIDVEPNAHSLGHTEWKIAET